MGHAETWVAKRQRPLWVAGDADNDLVEIPLLGWVAAGVPMEICTWGEQVAAPRRMVRRNTYALQVRGHSMIEDDIHDGDVIVVEKSETANNGQSVVAMINGEQVTLKRFYVEKDGIRLQPANAAMEPIWLRNEEIQILGIVAGVLRCT